jgi:hypothetical protein
MSEAQDQYRGEFIPAERANKQQYVHQQRPFEGTTTQQSDFVYFGHIPRRAASEAARGNSQVFANNLPFEGTTTAKHDFRRWNARPARSVKEQDSRPIYVSDNRNFATEASSQFQYKPVKVRASCAPELTAARRQAFEATTTNRADYLGWNQAPTKSFARTRQYRPRPDDRNFQTECRGQFTEKRNEPCPVRGLVKGSKEVPGHIHVEYDTRTGTMRRSQRLPAVR